MRKDEIFIDIISLKTLIINKYRGKSIKRKNKVEKFYEGYSLGSVDSSNDDDDDDDDNTMRKYISENTEREKREEERKKMSSRVMVNVITPLIYSPSRDIKNEVENARRSMEPCTGTRL